MDSSSVVLGLRVVLSLAVVLGLVWWLARRGGGARVKATTVQVVGRQSLGRRAGVAVVEVEGRRLLLGVTDQGVSMLTELATRATSDARTEIDPAELARLVDLDGDLTLATDPATDPDPTGELTPEPDGEPVRVPRTIARAARPARSAHRPAARTPAVPMPHSPLEGSVLDAATWRQAVAAVQERTIRR
jgi:flagellar protein FliO/FliZ